MAIRGRDPVAQGASRLNAERSGAERGPCKRGLDSWTLLEGGMRRNQPTDCFEALISDRHKLSSGLLRAHRFNEHDWVEPVRNFAVDLKSSRMRIVVPRRP